MLDRRELLAMGAASFTLSACASLASSTRRIRVATFNIWHDAGDWPARLPLLVQALRGIDADVIGLQEVLQDSGKNLPNQARTIADALGGYSVHFASTAPKNAANRYGNAILSRLPAVSEDWRALAPASDHRTALRLRVNLGSRSVDVVNTHLAWKPEQGPMRAQQIGDLLEWLPADSVPRIVMGDFNAELSAPELAPLTNRFTSALAAGASDTTLNTAEGHRARVIDHIFVDPAFFTVTDARRFGDLPVGANYPSDHFGVAAELRVG
ncbi:endonuclease/exonuclease/phosphatase family protein [Qipengyuania atrilutea]|uniref:Endonuclease/exonuclease/phosphatase family protein n=1 Tax=Qipengyuania atrilutea TaxID=2744473 RepID=A0A850H5N6_9SPHN|nr:endonuclease/exonuclease/phosphatase family protein [Actirhodobacter atriluteus]NVD45163.1 endonuclease/exonuclease/phosphatase family protein [Actirhodobacter atriluteus]